eukprot:COSAG01_NODE_4683_length_4818_cov_2.240305_2_plen_110_part_00
MSGWQQGAGWHAALLRCGRGVGRPLTAGNPPDNWPRAGVCHRTGRLPIHVNQQNNAAWGWTAAAVHPKFTMLPAKLATAGYLSHQVREAAARWRSTHNSLIRDLNPVCY